MSYDRFNDRVRAATPAACAFASRRSLGPLVAATLSLACLVPTAGAQNADCATLPNPVYFPATTLLETLLAKLLPTLANEEVVGDDQMTVVYFPLSSCITYDINREQTALSGTATYYDKDGTQLSCDVGAGSEIKADLSAMDVGGVTCLGGDEPPAELAEYPAHVEALGFVVPRNSTQTAITATEAYYLMKFAGEKGYEIEPWTSPDFIFVRNPGSSTQLTVGANIGISGTMWNGELHGHQGSGDLRDSLVAQNATGNAEKAIGILNSSKWEAATDDLKILAFQPFNGCLGALYPDSTSTSRDKRNVRDGHYPIWTNLRFIVRQDQDGDVKTSNGEAAAARVRRFVDLMTGTATLDGLDVAKAVIETGNIPPCAMHVKRDIDGGPMSAFEHPTPCDCFFLEQNGVDSGCKQCKSDDDCSGSGACNFGYCEDR